jgi:hypothetical protein
LRRCRQYTFFDDGANYEKQSANNRKHSTVTVNGKANLKKQDFMFEKNELIFSTYLSSCKKRSFYHSCGFLDQACISGFWRLEGPINHHHGHGVPGLIARQDADLPSRVGCEKGEER